MLEPILHLISSLATHLVAVKAMLLQHHGLSVRELLVLAIVTSTRETTLTELHRILGVQKSALSSLLERLRRKSLIVRTQSQEDRRRWKIALTPHGEVVMNQLMEEEQQLLGPAFETLSDEEKATLLTVTNNLTQQVIDIQRQRGWRAGREPWDRETGAKERVKYDQAIAGASLQVSLQA
jgi:DNA-binding MarR family transcriptional regulator